MPKATQLLTGIVILAIACWTGAYAGVAMTVLTMGFLGGAGELISFVLPFGLAIVLFFGGMRPGKYGYTWAPVVFFGGWALVSVAMRGYLSAEAAKIVPPEIDPGLAKIRTLVINDHQKFSRTFVTEGVVDRLVEIAYEQNDRAKPINSIRQTTLASGEACTKDDDSYMLRAAGRVDECLKVTQLTAVPDGLHILFPSNYAWGPGWRGPLTATVVENGQEREGIQWRRFSARVPAYAPLFKMNMGPFDRAQTIWETRTGPFEVVRYGDLDLTPQAMAAAIYAFDPSLPPKPKGGNDLLAKRASDLASAGDHGAALSIVALLDKANYLDDNMIRAAAYNIFVDVNSSIAGGRLTRLDQFAEKLSHEQRKLLNGQIIQILTTPGKCNCHASLFNSVELGQLAVDAFQNTSGLELWQYDGLLSATMYVATPFEEHREKLFASIMASHDPSNPRRIVAYFRKTGFTLLDAEMRALTPKLAELDGDGLFLIATVGGHRIHPPWQVAKFSTAYNPDLQVKRDTWHAFWAALDSLAGRIPNEEQRRRALDDIRKWQLEE